MPGYFGTLAAARQLGRQGVHVVTSGSGAGAPAAQSRFVSQHLSCPDENNPEILLDWLVSYGKTHPGTVLYPTSDDYAWLQSSRRELLSPYFKMYSPDEQAIANVLDKRKLFEACQRAGIDVPETWFVESDADMERIAQQATFPVLLKQRTQVFSNTKSKGMLIHSAEELRANYDKFRVRNSHAAAVIEHMPYASWPMLQAYYPAGNASNYLVSGFVTRDHRHIVAQAAVKVLQYPRSLGIALCMECAPIDQQLLDQLLQLFKDTGYFGVFQIEFLVSNGRRMLNDFNPRFYHYMEFDIARGIPLAWLAYLGARGDEQRLVEEMAKARQQHDQNTALMFTCRYRLKEMIWSQKLTGTMSWKEFRYWQHWARQNRKQMVDAVADADDPKPEGSVKISALKAHLRHPRAFIRMIALDRASF